MRVIIEIYFLGTNYIVDPMLCSGKLIYWILMTYFCGRYYNYPNFFLEEITEMQGLCDSPKVRQPVSDRTRLTI